MSSPSPNASGSSRRHLHGLNILQTNMRHCTTGYLLLTQLLNERRFDIILIQDPPPQLTNQHKCPPGFRVLKPASNSPPSTPTTEDPLSLILNKNNIPVRSFPLPSNRFCGAFVSTRLGTLGLVSAYLPLHASVELSHLSTVLDTIRHTTPLYLIGGDFNGHSRWWGPPSQQTNPNGALIEDFILDNCCGPEGRRWFSESPGSPRPAAPLGGGGAVSTTFGGRFRGARFLGRAVGPCHAGDRPPERAVCGGWQRSRVR